MNSNEANDELDWLAFRYIAGELNESEAARFEERLATDQSAREAVARNVELGSLISTSVAKSHTSAKLLIAAHNPNPRGGLPRSRWRLLTTVAAVTGIACGVLFWRATSRDEGNKLDVARTEETLTNAEQLVALWVEAPTTASNTDAQAKAATDAGHERPAADEPRDDLVADISRDETQQEQLTGMEGDRPGDSTAVPEWMLAGVSLEMARELPNPAKGDR